MNFWDSDIPESLTGLEIKTFLNKKRILKHLHRQGTLSGSDISTILNVSIPKSNAYLNELVNEGYVEIKGKGESIGGRKPNIYGLRENSVFIIAVDMGRKFLGLALFNNELKKIVSKKLPPVALVDRKKVIETIFEQAQLMLTEAGVEMKKVMGVGINMPGLVNSATGINYTYLFNSKQTLVDDFKAKFKRPVFLENDSKARALAELKYGAAKESKNALVIQIDWGLGLGMILNGKLYKGNSGFAGEFSHIPIDENGVLCICGKVGCLETIASGNALVRFALESLEANCNSKLYEVFKDDPQSITPALIIEAGNSGDQFALSLIQRVGAGLGKGISYLIQILNPEVVILGGVLSHAGKYLETPIKQAIFQYCLPNLHEDIQILISPLGSDIGLIGSAVVVIDNILENN